MCARARTHTHKQSVGRQRLLYVGMRGSLPSLIPVELSTAHPAHSSLQGMLLEEYESRAARPGYLKPNCTQTHADVGLFTYIWMFYINECVMCMSCLLLYFHHYSPYNVKSNTFEAFDIKKYLLNNHLFLD